MNLLPKNVSSLIEEFSKLPSIGPKTAERLTFYLLKNSDLNSLGEAVLQLRDNLTKCEVCVTYTDTKICSICSNTNRDNDVLAVVSQPLDIVAIEKTGLFRGKYHVLHGFISPVDGIGPDDLEIESLIKRITKVKPKEIIIATNPNIEGETTAFYLAKKIARFNIKVTRIAHGLPVGGDIEYADQITLSRALDNRRELNLSK
ncbi:MAG: recombination mediator RecR [bacterium]|nr:recombination mediator RecR [bacterium]